VSSNYADSISAAKRNVAGQAEKKRPQRDAGVSAGVAAELRGAIAADLAATELPDAASSVSEPVTRASAELVVAKSADTAPAPSKAEPDLSPSSIAASGEVREATVDAAPTLQTRKSIVRQGIDFRRADLDLVTDMLYRCHQRRIRLPGKKGPSVIVRAALDELAAVYSKAPEQFDEIMQRYAEKRDP